MYFWGRFSEPDTCRMTLFDDRETFHEWRSWFTAFISANVLQSGLKKWNPTMTLLGKAEL